MELSVYNAQSILETTEIDQDLQRLLKIANKAHIRFSIVLSITTFARFCLLFPSRSMSGGALIHNQNQIYLNSSLIV